MGSRECVGAYIHGKELDEVGESGVPNNVLDLYQKIFDVQRYFDEEYPKDRLGNLVISDWVGCHTNRCRAWARTMKLSEGVNRQKLEQILILHDLAEAGKVKDMTGVKKEAEPDLAKVVADEELIRAKNRFTKRQLALYEDFEKAKDFLSTGKGEGFSAEALLARLIEQVDGNIIFHYLWSRWVLNEDYDANYQMPVSAANYTNIKTIKFRGSLDNHPDEQIRECGLGILDQQIDYVKSFWQEVKDSYPNRMPAQLVWLGMGD